MVFSQYSKGRSGHESITAMVDLFDNRLEGNDRFDTIDLIHGSDGKVLLRRLWNNNEDE